MPKEIGSLPGNLPPAHLRAAQPTGAEALLSQVRRARASGEEEALRRVSREFEAIFLQRLLAEMRKSIPKGGLFERSLAREWFEGMLDEAVAKEISQGPGVGLGDVIFEQLGRLPGRPGPAPGADAAAAPAPEEGEVTP